MLGAGAGGLAQLVVDGRAIGLLIFEAPEIEAADAVGLEGFAEIDAACEHFVLLLEVEVGVELIAARAFFGYRRAGPMDFEERAGNVGDAQLVLVENLARAVDLVGVQIGDVLVPHAADLDPVQAEVVGGHRTGVIEVRAKFRR